PATAAGAAGVGTPTTGPGAIHATAAGAAGAEHLLVLSARSARSLTQLAQTWAAYLDSPGRRHPLHELCAAAALRRDAHPYRLWARGTTHADIAARLRALAAGEPVVAGGTAEAGFRAPRRTAFVFPGQGSQWLGMGRGLLGSSPAFRATLTECDSAIRAELGWSVVDLLAEATEFPTDIDRVQPALWAVQVSLAAALREAGLDPDVCLGHSMGEIAASYVAGALSLRDACTVICRRSRLMRRLAGRGAMLAVELSADAVREVLAGREEFAAVCVAAENSPTATVLAGPPQALAAVTETLERRDVLCRTVRVEVASHSPDMDLISDELVAALEDLAPRPAATGLVSSVVAAPVRGDELLPRYWQDNLRRPVRFTEAVRLLCREETLFLEVSPHPLLASAIDETRRSVPAEGAAIATLHHGCDEAVALLETLGRAFAHGARVDWTRWYGAVPPVVDDLPTYAWDSGVLRRPGASALAAPAPAAAPAPCVREAALRDWGVVGWGTGVSVRGFRPVLPTVYLGAMFEAARAAAGDRFALTDVRLGDTVLTLDELPDALLRVTIGGPGPNGLRRVRAEARRTANAPLELCAEGTLEPRDSGAAQLGNRRKLLDSALTQQLDYLSADDFLDVVEELGFGIDEDLWAVQHVWRRGGQAVARLRPAPGSAAGTSMQAVCAASAASWESGMLALLAAYRPGTAYVPTGFGSVQVHGELGGEFWALCRVRPAEGGQGRARGDVLFLDSDGFVLAEFLAIELQALPHRRPGLLASFAAATPLAALSARLHPDGAASSRRRPASWVTLPRGR
ncbi:MAG: acyltransferase domain-containing protein, partial [Streptomyces sp.]|nr:acyltransferase domain-containing protein [Streptomyces sp.]